MKSKTTFSLRNTLATAVAVLVCLALTASVAFAQARPKPKLPTESMIKRITKAMPARATAKPAKPRKILVFWLCKGFFHSSIPVANKAFEIMGEKTGAFETVVSDDMAMFDPENLNQFDAVLFNNTTQLKFEDPEQRKALLDFVKGGKGMIGIHAAADNFYNWPEASEMLGGLFDGHPWGAGGTWAFKLDEPDHPLNKAFDGKGFLLKDEIYQMKSPPYSRDTLRVLLTLDMSAPRNLKVKGMKRTDNDYAVAWIRDYGDGRVFHSGLGHNNQLFWNEAVLQHYLDGIQYALGDFKVDATPSAVLRKKPKGWQSLFDGKSLDGWVQRNGRAKYRVDDGAIVGTSVKGSPNSFLCTERLFSDFILELDFKVDPGLNSGVQIRSSSFKEYRNGRVHGYQVEIDPSDRAYSAGIYDEGRRGWLYDLAGNGAARKAFKQGQWNQFRIEAVGQSIKTWLNGVAAANLVDAMTPTGFVALQVHGTQSDDPMEARWRNIRIQELEGPGAPTSASDAPPIVSLNNLDAWREPRGAWKIVKDTFTSPSDKSLLGSEPGTGAIVNGKKGRTSNLFTKMVHDDIEAHVEFMVPKGSNSGVYFQGRYEIQVLDSWGVKKPQHSDCGGIYQRWHDEPGFKDEDRGYEGRPPRVNVSRKPGEWQSFDVIFRAPRFDATGKKIANAVFVKVVHNGTVVHENEEVTGPTRAAAFKDEKPVGPLMFQGDHGPVAYRNILVRALNDTVSTAANNPGNTDIYEQVLAYEFGQSREALTAIEEDIRNATPARRKAIEEKLLVALKSPKATYDCKQFVCRMLRRVGTDQSVPALGALLADEKLSHMARFALENIPGPVVDEALRAALDQTTGKTKVGIVSSLGKRRDSDAVDLLGKLQGDQDKAVAAAAATALGEIGSQDAVMMLAGAWSRGNPELREVVARAAIRSADRLLAQGQTDLAATIFDRVYSSDAPTAIRAAALRGLVIVRAEESAPLVANALAGDSTDFRDVGLRVVRDGFGGNAATQQIIKLLPSVPAQEKVLVLGALSERGDTAAVPTLLETATDPDALVRLASLDALGALTDRSHLVPLVELVFRARDDDEREAAEKALLSMAGRDAANN